MGNFSTAFILLIVYYVILIPPQTFGFAPNCNYFPSTYPLQVKSRNDCNIDTTTTTSNHRKSQQNICLQNTNKATSLEQNSEQGCSEPSQKEISSVTVFDRVFSPFACEELHYLAIDHSERGDDGSSIFVRPPNNERPLTPLENAIDSALTAIGDTSKKVEYWSREEYMNIDVHADIDEIQLEEQSELRCPEMGHILYLQVKKGLKCPTCIFPNKHVGWGFYEDDEDEQNVDLVTVPALKGRIVRFPGSAMHAVPMPANRWFLTRDEERKLRSEEEEEEEEISNDDEEWLGDDDLNFEDDDEEIVERSVLLFNTWHDEEPGPRGVGGDYLTGALPDGIEIDEDEVDSFVDTEDAQRLLEWEEEYGLNSEALQCNPRSEWKNTDIIVHSTSKIDNNDKVTPMLMGKQKRRVSFKKSVCLTGPSLALHGALEEEQDVWQFQMTEDIDLKP